MASFNLLTGWATARVPYSTSNELWEGGAWPHYHGSGKSPDPPPRPPVTPAQWGGDGDVLRPGGVEVWAPPSVSSFTNGQRCQGEVQAPRLVFTGMGGSGATVFSMVFGWSAVGIA